MTEGPDPRDLQIIQLLQEDGRRSTAAMARQLSLPEATVRRRIDRLVREGIIKIVAVADSAKLGLPIHVLIALQVDLTRVEEVGAALQQLDEVRWVGVTTGSQEFVVEAFFHSTQHFHDFLVKKIGAIPGVTRTRTSTVLRLLKNIYRWDILLEAGDGRGGAPAPTEVAGARSSPGA